jgi:hypothetical protein
VNRSVIFAARLGFERVINENPAYIAPVRKALIDRGDGVMIHEGAPETLPTVRVRIAYEGALQDREASPVGLSSNLSQFVTMDYLVPLQEGDEFTLEGDSWRVGLVNAHRRFGAVIGATAPIYRSEAAA